MCPGSRTRMFGTKWAFFSNILCERDISWYKAHRNVRSSNYIFCTFDISCFFSLHYLTNPQTSSHKHSSSLLWPPIKIVEICRVCPPIYILHWINNIRQVSCKIGIYLQLVWISLCTTGLTSELPGALQGTCTSQLGGTLGAMSSKLPNFLSAPDEVVLQP